MMTEPLVVSQQPYPAPRPRDYDVQVAVAVDIPVTGAALVHDWFTEGFDTDDLKDAKALLDELI